MAKALKTAAIVVGAVALIASGVGAAGSVGLLGATTVAAGATAATVATLATIATIATVASVAAGVLSIAAGLTAKKPVAQATGSQTQFAADPDAGIPLVIGRTGTAGNIVARFGWDTRDAGDNDRQAFVSVLSLGPVKEIEPALSVDRVPVYFDGQGRAIGGFSGFMWRTAQVGLLASAALGFGTGAGSPPAWGAQHALSGKAATTWTLRFDTKSKLYQNGVPAPMNVVRGQYCYDPRKDSTYPGGSGPHRMADPADRAAYDAAVATWEYSECPFLNGLRFVHGYWQRDMADPASVWQRVMGMGAPLAGIDLASFVEGANVADAHGWKAGGVIYSGDDKWASLKTILQAGMGEPLALGAKISCLVNAPKVSLATITEDDVVGECSVGATQPRRDRVNTITPKFRLEENGWQLLPGAPISVPEHVVADRGKRSRAQEYRLIQSAPQVGTAVRYDIENAREFGQIVLPCKLYCMGYKPGDCVTATLPEVGLNGQPILLLNRSLAGSNGIVTLTARSETPGKHAFALGQTATPPPTPGVTGAPIVPVPGVDAWAITGTSVTANGVTMPALIVAGSVDAGTAQSVTFDYRQFISGQAQDDGWVGAGVEPADVTTKAITGVASATAYEVSVRYTVRGVLGQRRIIGPVSTAAYEGIRGANGTSPYNAILSNESHTLPADAAGNVLSYSGASFTVTVFYGSQDVTGSFALDAVDNPQGLTGPPGYPTYSIDGGFDAAEPSASVTYHFVGRGGTPHAGVRLSKTFSLAKSLGGAGGAPAPLITLTASALTLRAGTDGNFIGGQRIDFNAVRTNLPGTTYFLLKNVNGSNLFAGSAAEFVASDPVGWGSDGPDSLYLRPENAVSIMNAHGGAIGRFSITAYVNGYTVTDTVSIQKVQDGAKGADGKNAINVIADNETFTVPTDVAGNYAAFPVDVSRGTLRVYDGATEVTGSCTFRAGALFNLDGRMDGASYYSVGLYADTGYADFIATYRGVDYVARVTASKVKGGPKGADGINPPAVSVSAAPQAIRYNQNGAYAAGDVTFTAIPVNAVGPVAFSSLIGHQIYGLPDSLVSFSNGGNTMTIRASRMGDMIGYNEANTSAATETIIATTSGVSDRVTVTKIKDGAKGADSTVPGPPGNDGINIITSPTAFTIPSYSNGATKPEWTGGSCRIALIKGSQEVAADSYNFVNQQNMASIRMDGQTVLFADIVGNRGEFTARAVRNGVAFDQRVTVTRPLDGNAAFRTDANYNFSGGSGTSTASAPVAGNNRTVRITSRATYNSPINFDGQGTLALYWQNQTAGGPLNFLGSIDGSYSSYLNTSDNPDDPRYQRISGSVSLSKDFPGPSDLSQILYQATFTTKYGQIADVTGNITLEVL